MVVAAQAYSGTRAVVVAVKLDSHSRKMLTWALMKVAQAGDRVVALHVLDTNEIVDRQGKSSFLSLVNAFDSILAVHEDFCNLRQVDLKLKICRGSSVRRIIVCEAKAQGATELLVGASQINHRIRSSVSIAKYCAKKLPEECSVITFNDGKILFHRESKSKSTFPLEMEESEFQSCNSLLSALQKSFTKSFKLSDGDGHSPKQALTWEAKSPTSPDLIDNDLNCPCSTDSAINKKSLTHDLAKDNDKMTLQSIVPVYELETETNLPKITFMDVPETKPGWPFLHQTSMLSQRRSNNSKVREISVVQWALRLPDRNCLPIANSPYRNTGSNLNAEAGSIVSKGENSTPVLVSPDRCSRPIPKELEGLHEKYSATCRLFNFQELASATSNFAPGNMIGKGGSSQVYRGYLRDSKEIAVKILKPSEDALKEFIHEIEIISSLHHKNVISLFGFCNEEKHLLLVYDFLSRGSLGDSLHGNKKETMVFGWDERYRVAIGVAEALDYLHNREGKPVIHRDVKSSNILLSNNFEPQLSDFGLAKWASCTSMNTTYTDVAGTFGYLAPEYFMYGKVNEKIDVYAYGVVLLELLSGRKPISRDCPKGEESLVLWAKPLLNSDFSRLLDPNMGSNYNHQQAKWMALAASLCLRREQRERPQMSLVLKLLRGETEMVDWARFQAIGEAEAFDDETSPPSNLQSHLNLALLGVEEDSVSISNICPRISLRNYLRERRNSFSSVD